MRLSVREYMKCRISWLELWEWKALQQDSADPSEFRYRAALFALDRLIRTHRLLQRSKLLEPACLRLEWQIPREPLLTPSPAIEHRLVSLFLE
jgi:hypothetical protein